MIPNPKRKTSGTLPIASTLGGRIRAERQRRGWTQAELASAVGASEDAIVRIETGESVASDDDVARFAAALGVPVAQLAYAPDPTGMTKRGVG